MESKTRIALGVAIQGRILCILVPWFISASSLITQKNSTQLRKDSQRIKSDSNKHRQWRKMAISLQGSSRYSLHSTIRSISKRKKFQIKRKMKKETNIRHSIGEVMHIFLNLVLWRDLLIASKFDLNLLH